MAESKTDFNESNFFTYIWTIENMRTPCSIYSPTFTLQAKATTKWALFMFCGYSGNMTAKLQRKGKVDKPDVIDVKCELALLGTNGLPLIKEVREKKIKIEDELNFYTFCEEKHVFNLRRAEFLPNGALTVRCLMWIRGNETPNPHLCYGRTVLRMERYTFIWTIKEFSSLQPGQGKTILLNPTAKEEFQWRLNLFVDELNAKQYLCFNMLFEDGDFFCWYKVKVDLLDVDGQILLSNEDNGDPCDGEQYKYFFEKSILMGIKVYLLHNDVLSMRCKFEVLVKVYSRIENDRSLMLEETVSDMNIVNFGKKNETSAFIEAIKSLLVEGILSDVHLRASSISFAAHKCILSARSPVFKAMFNGDMKEKTSKCVEIPDIDEDTMRRLLSYIYTDSVGDLQWQEVVDLYSAADKYELLDLKKTCSTFLKSNVDVSNVCSFLVLGDMQNDQELRKTAQNFIMRQGADFFKTGTWRNFKEENPKLYVEELERIVYKMKILQEGSRED